MGLLTYEIVTSMWLVGLLVLCTTLPVELV